MRVYDLILKKRNGIELSSDEISYIIENYTKGLIPDYQISALLMAIYFKKMSKKETIDLTKAMINSGDVINLKDINGIKVDKHSTGGVGDTTSLILGPLIASLGIPVAKMSGRGLGHTGGTIDKLESFEGFRTEIPIEKFIENVNNIKLSIAGQTATLVPADKKLYSLRDVTATVDNTSLIASSIMSKKIASGADAIVLDVKVGDGAFMKDVSSAKELAELMVEIGNGLGRNTVAVLSDMDQPLGYAIGNNLEVIEAIETLKGNGPKDLFDLCIALGSETLILANKAQTVEEATKMLNESIKNGAALNKFKEFIQAQGGNAEAIYDTSKFPKAEFVIPVKANKQGFVKKIHAQSVGIIAMELGAGRATKESVIDLSVGIVLAKKRGEYVNENDIIAYIHANDLNKGNIATEKLLQSYDIVDEYKDSVPLIYDIIK